MNCFAIISLLIASLGRHESRGSLGVTKSATFTHWPAFGRHSLPPFRLLLLLSLPINWRLPPHFCRLCRSLPFCTPLPFSPFPLAHASPLLHTCLSNLSPSRTVPPVISALRRFFAPPTPFPSSSSPLPLRAGTPGVFASAVPHPNLTVKCTLERGRVFAWQIYGT